MTYEPVNRQNNTMLAFVSATSRGVSLSLKGLALAHLVRFKYLSAGLSQARFILLRLRRPNNPTTHVITVYDKFMTVSCHSYVMSLL